MVSTIEGLIENITTQTIHLANYSDLFTSYKMSFKSSFETTTCTSNRNTFVAILRESVEIKQ